MTPTQRPGPLPESESPLSGRVFCPAATRCQQRCGPRFTFCSLLACAQVLLGFPRPLQPGGGASVPGAGVYVPEGPAVSSEELGQHRVFAAVRPLVLVLAGESQVRSSAPKKFQLSGLI